MRTTVVLLAIAGAATAPMSGQVPGDSIRLRLPPSRAWTYGRLVSTEAGQLTITHADSNQSYSFQTVGRFEVRRRKNVALNLLAPALAAMAAEGVAALIRPADQESVFGTGATPYVVAAGIGLAIGAIDLAISPWQWKRVRLGVKAAP